MVFDVGCLIFVFWQDLSFCFCYFSLVLLIVLELNHVLFVCF